MLQQGRGGTGHKDAKAHSTSVQSVKLRMSQKPKMACTILPGTSALTGPVWDTFKLWGSAKGPDKSRAPGPEDRAWGRIDGNQRRGFCLRAVHCGGGSPHELLAGRAAVEAEQAPY